MSKFNIGDKVRYIGKDHKDMPGFYPEIGTIGTVIEKGGDTDWYIQWSKGSTSGKDCWYCDENDIELVKDVDMTNEEIWEMLESKMGKNGLKPCGSRLLFTNGIANVYAWEDVHNAIALAYKVGYLRAIKGRPFKFGKKKEKKKGGYWEPVDPNNLPKEGTKVRYARKCKSYDNSIIKLGDTGIVEWDGVYNPIWFGVKPDNPRSWMKWLSFDEEEDSLDMWVEDDK